MHRVLVLEHARRQLVACLVPRDHRPGFLSPPLHTVRVNRV